MKKYTGGIEDTLHEETDMSQPINETVGGRL